MVARHGLFNPDGGEESPGDLDVDCHHAIEDRGNRPADGDDP